MPVIPAFRKLRQEDQGFKNTRHRWLTPAIPATQEAEIRRITVQSQPGPIVHKIISKSPVTEKGL
jgi:hypothetical protein